ncbi:hypothetical protein AOLI_G00054990 [Acnodon oligacanthus]
MLAHNQFTIFILQSASVLCFTVDTSVSVADGIAEVKYLTSFIIDHRQHTVDEPMAYILVPFNILGWLQCRSSLEDRRVPHIGQITMQSSGPGGGT